jgi:K+-transporting ATPase ATPase C chain
MTRFTSTTRRYAAALRILVLFTVLLGVIYPLAVTAIAQVPGLKSRADGSLITSNGQIIGSRLIGQAFTDDQNTALVQYLQSRPSAAGTGAPGYDPTSSGASNLGPESVLDTLPDPATPGDTGKQALLTRVCGRSQSVGQLEGVDGSRPYCTPGGVGAVLVVFYAGPGYQGPVTRVVSVNEACPAQPFVADYAGVTVQCATYGADYTAGQTVPIRGSAPTRPAVPADAVTASGSGLDPHISPAYADLQAARIATARGISATQVRSVIAKHTAGRGLGFLGEPSVNVVQVNLDLDRDYPYRAQ